MDTTQIAEKLELHYVFDDKSHFMDAFVRNKCEAEFLAIAKELAGQLGIDIKLDSEALVEGGLIDYIKVLVKNHPALSAALSMIFINILINVVSDQITTDRELVSLQKEACRLQIERFKKEEKSEASPSSDRSAEQITVDILNSHKVRKRRSNFYEGLLNCQKVAAVDWVGVDSENKPTDDPKSVKRVDFHKFILTSDELEPVVDENAIIEIIAPVLKKGKYKWRGIYEGESISFKMKDSSFKADVFAGGVPFINGTCIDCVLTISRKLDECGGEQNFGYTVQVVTKVHDEKASVETPQGKKYKRQQELERNSLEFDFEKNAGANPSK